MLLTILLLSMLYDLRDAHAYLDNITVCGKAMKDHDHNFKALFSAAKSENLTFDNSKCVICSY